MVQLLPAVADAVHIAGLIHALVNALKAGHEGQESRAHTHPQDDDDQHRHDVIGIRQPELGRVDQAEVEQHGVQVAVGVASEDDREDRVRVARDAGCVENHHSDGAQPLGQLVDEPGEHEGQDVAHRTGDHRDDEGVLHRGQEHLILQDQVDVVL